MKSLRNPCLCLCVFADMHVADVRVLSMYVHAGLFMHVYIYYVFAHVND